MGGKECFINVETVKEKIPVLLSKQLLTNAKALIDIANDKMNVFDKNVDFYFSTSTPSLTWIGIFFCKIAFTLNF